MTLYLDGTREEKDCDSKGCESCEYKIEEKDLGACVLENDLISACDLAIVLAEYVDQDTSALAELGEDLRKFERRDNKLLPHAWRDSFVELTLPLKAALVTKFGENMVCSREQAERLDSIYRRLWSFDTDADGNKIWNLRQAWWNVGGCAHFLRRSKELKRDVWCE